MYAFSFSFSQNEIRHEEKKLLESQVLTYFWILNFECFTQLMPLFLFILETDFESLIQKHSTSNSSRHSNDNNTGSSSSIRKQRQHGHTADDDSLSSSSLLTDHSTASFNNFSSSKTMNSNNNVNNMSMCTINQDGTQAKVVILPKHEQFSTETSSVASSANSACASSCPRASQRDNFHGLHESTDNTTPCCTQSGRQGRHFEPPPPYSPPKQYGAFV